MEYHNSMEKQSEPLVQPELWTSESAVDESASEARPLHWCEGVWEHEGQTIATIRGSTVCYVGGGRAQPVHISGDRLLCNIHGSTCEARSGPNGQLVWNDGNIWVRKLTHIAQSQFLLDVAHVESAVPTVTWRGMIRALPNDDRGSVCTEEKPNSAGIPAAMAAAASVAKFRGVAALQNHDFADAVQHLLEATKLNPSDRLAQQLLKSSQLSAWAVTGIPVLQFDNIDAAARLVDEFGKLSSKAKVEGHAALQAHKFDEAVRCFSKALIHSPNDELAEILLQHAKLRQWEAQGLPVMRLACYEDSIQLAEQIEEVNGMSMAVLREWYFAAGFPDEQSLEREKIVWLLKQVRVWHMLPLNELHQECDRQGISVCTAWMGDLEAETEALRNHLCKQLLLKAWMDARQARGISAHRIGDARMVIQLVQEYELADKMSFAELSDWYCQLGFPVEPNLQLDEMLSLFKAIAFWQALPLAELQRECKECLPQGQINDDELSLHNSADGIQEHVTTLVQRLVLCNRMQAWESRGCYQASRLGDADVVVEVIHRHNEIDGMNRQELDAWYAGCGFPDGNCLEANDVVSLRKLVAIWQFLSLEELRQECICKGLLEASTVVSDEAQRPRLVDQLLIHERMEAWEATGLPARRIGEPVVVAQLVQDCQAIGMLSMQQLHAWYAGLGLPIERNTPREELMRLHKAGIIWSALPLHELQKECISLGVEIPALDEHQESDEQRSRLVYALLMHDRMKAWNLQGFETHRLGQLETVLQLVRTYESYECMEDEEFASACAEEGLSLSGKTSRTELMPWLKVLLVWQVLPLQELVVECQERGLPTNMPLLPANIDTEQLRQVLLQQLQADMKLSLAVGGCLQKRSSANDHQSADGMPILENVSTAVAKDAPVQAGTCTTKVETSDANINSVVGHSKDEAADKLVGLDAPVNGHSQEMVGAPKVGTLAFEAFLDEHGFGSRRPLLQEELSDLQEICGQISSGHNA